MIDLPRSKAIAPAVAGVLRSKICTTFVPKAGHSAVKSARSQAVSGVTDAVVACDLLVSAARDRRRSAQVCYAACLDPQKASKGCYSQLVVKILSYMPFSLQPGLNFCMSMSLCPLTYLTPSGWCQSTVCRPLQLSA